MKYSEQIGTRSAEALVVSARHNPPPHFFDIDEVVPDLVTYWRVVLKRRWTVLMVLAVIFSLVFIDTVRQTPMFRATVLVEIQRENPEILSIQELFELDVVSDTYLESQYRILKSESLASQVIRELQLHTVDEFKSPSRRSWFGQSKEETSLAPPLSVGDVAQDGEGADFSQVVAKFQGHLSITPIKRSRLVEVSFLSMDPNLAARIANSVVRNFVNSNFEARRRSTRQVSEWLSVEAIEVQGKLEESEERLQEYASKNGFFFLETQQGIVQTVNERLRLLSMELVEAQARRIEKDSLYRLLSEGDPGALPGMMDNRLIQDLSLQLAGLKREAAKLSETYTPEYPKVKQLQSQIDELDAELMKARGRIVERIRNEYLAAVNRERLLQEMVSNQEKLANVIAEKSIQYNILKREVDSNSQIYEGILQSKKEAEASIGLKATNIRVVDPARPPRVQASPRLLLNLSIGLVLGMVAGIGAGFLQEYLDRTLKTTDDVERYLRLPTLGLIPFIDSMNGNLGVFEAENSGTGSPVSPGDPVGLLADGRSRRHGQGGEGVFDETIRNLRTSVLLSSPDRPPRTILVTSALPGEGKSTVCFSLASSLVQLGKKVLLIDCDLRRPSVHKLSQLDGKVGMANYLVGLAEWRDIVMSATRLPGLDILMAGVSPPNPAELLSSTRLVKLLEEATKDYDFVLIDSAPIMSIADTRILTRLVDGVVYVLHSGITPRDIASKGCGYIKEAGANVIGVVLNNVNMKPDLYYYYAHNYGTLFEDASPESEESEVSH